MSEALVVERKLKSGGWQKIWVDREHKLVKNIINGRMEDDETIEVCQSAINELKKYVKGEPKYLVDTTNMDMRFFSPKQTETIGEFGKFAGSYCKKCAYVMPSFMLQKSTGAVVSDLEINDKYFATEQEAVKWLLAD